MALRASASVTGELEAALRAGELLVHYQPMVDLVSHAVLGAEALLRWQRADGVLLAAEKFIPHVRGSRVLRAIDDWVLYEASTVAARLQRIRPDFRIWVNVSPLDLGDGTLLERIRDHRTAPRAIGVEINEGAMMRNVDVAVDTLETLRQAGIAVALDDFGTGHSSFGQLARLPLDVVKLERSFTAGLRDDERKGEVVDAIAELTRRFGFALIAAGIERPGQAETLHAAGCRFGQGFLFGRAAAAQTLEASVHAQAG